jgi:hypothetical protein
MSEIQTHPSSARYSVREIGNAFWLCKSLLRPFSAVQNPVKKFATRSEAMLMAKIHNAGRTQPTEAEIRSLVWQPKEVAA